MFSLAICTILNRYTQVHIKILLIQSYHTTCVYFSCEFISFWSKLIETDNPNKLSVLMYHIVYDLSNKNITEVKRINSIKESSGVWDTQRFLNKTWLVKSINSKLKDISIQEWTANIEATSQRNFSKIFKTLVSQSEFLRRLPSNLCKLFLRFRTRNHILPFETGIWRGIALNDRKCHLCNSDIGDEYHFLLVINFLTLKDVNILNLIITIDQTHSNLSN